MSKEYTYHKGQFEHHLLEGSHYEIGQKQGKIMKNKEAYTKFYTSGKFNKQKSKFENFKEVYDFYDSFCPGLSEEAQGFAEILETKLENLFFYDFPHSIQHCSQFAVLPQLTKNTDILVGRSYEWNHTDEDFELRTTKVKGKYKHMGFSGMVYGRYEGLNDQGLCITSSAGGAWRAKFENKSVNWALALRVILDNCKNVEEASKVLEEIPVHGTTIYLLVDKSGKAAVLESFDGQFEVQHYDERSKVKSLVATNHYNFSSNLKYNKFNNEWLLPNSQKRYKITDEFIQNNSGNITQKEVREFLSQEFPEGLCCHWYTDYFGTLWSVNFNVTEGKTEVCFGPPTHNEWFSFSLDDPVERKYYEVEFPDKRI